MLRMESIIILAYCVLIPLTRLLLLTRRNVKSFSQFAVGQRKNVACHIEKSTGSWRHSIKAKNSKHKNTT